MKVTRQRRNPSTAPSTLAVLVLCTAALLSPLAVGAETVKIAFIEVLSGPFGNAGLGSLNELRAVVSELNASNKPGDPTFEVVPFDGKGTPQESSNVLRAAFDQNIRYVTQGGGSGVAHAIVDLINKQAQRDPASAMVFLNYAAQDPALTGEKCSFWHFRFYPSSEMQINALTEYLKKQTGVKKVYLFNQNYAHGQQVAKSSRAFLAAKRPDIQIVGEEFVPIAAVRDFAPYVAKIAASGADTVITSNWGTDLSLLFRATQDYGLNAAFYTMSAINPGTPTQIGAWGTGKVAVLWNWLDNASGTPVLEQFAGEYKQKSGQDFINVAHWNSMHMLREAMRTAKSTDPRKVAAALEGMKYNSPMGEVEMRSADHQLQAPIYLGVWAKQGTTGVKYEAERTGFGFRSEAVWSAAESALPPTCKMSRP